MIAVVLSAIAVRHVGVESEQKQTVVCPLATIQSLVSIFQTSDYWHCETMFRPCKTHGSSGRCSLFSIHPISDHGNTFAKTFPFISANGNGP